MMPKQVKVIFLHIPKTAGTTLYDCLRQTYGKRHIIEFHGIVEKLAENFCQKFYRPQKSKITCIKGHMTFGLHHYIEEPVTYITCIRDPVKRILSLYGYLKRSRNHIQHNLVADKSLLEFIMTCQFHNNGQTRFLAGGNILESENVLLSRAKENLRNHFSVIVLTERFDESLVLLKECLCWSRLPVYTPENTAKKIKNPQSIDAETLKFIQQKNRADIELYEYAQTLFEQQIQQFPKNFEHELSAFRQTQKLFTPLRRVYSTSRALYFRAMEKIEACWGV